jgi:hypothetical protein
MGVSGSRHCNRFAVVAQAQTDAKPSKATSQQGGAGDFFGDDDEGVVSRIVIVLKHPVSCERGRQGVLF